MLTEHINETFAHIPIDTALDWIVNGGDAALYLEEDVE